MWPSDVFMAQNQTRLIVGRHKRYNSTEKRFEDWDTHTHTHTHTRQRDMDDGMTDTDMIDEEAQILSTSCQQWCQGCPSTQRPSSPSPTRLKLHPETQAQA